MEVSSSWSHSSPEEPNNLSALGFAMRRAWDPWTEGPDYCHWGLTKNGLQKGKETSSSPGHYICPPHTRVFSRNRLEILSRAWSQWQYIAATRDLGVSALCPNRCLNLSIQYCPSLSYCWPFFFFKCQARLSVFFLSSINEQKVFSIFCQTYKLNTPVYTTGFSYTIAR